MSNNSKPLSAVLGKLGLIVVLGAGIGTVVGSAIGNVPLGIAVGGGIALVIGAGVELWRRQQAH